MQSSQTCDTVMFVCILLSAKMWSRLLESLHLNNALGVSFLKVSHQSLQYLLILIRCSMRLTFTSHVEIDSKDWSGFSTDKRLITFYLSFLKASSLRCSNSFYKHFMYVSFSNIHTQKGLLLRPPPVLSKDDTGRNLKWAFISKTSDLESSIRQNKFLYQHMYFVM